MKKESENCEHFTSNGRVSIWQYGLNSAYSFGLFSNLLSMISIRTVFLFISAGFCRTHGGKKQTTEINNKFECAIFCVVFFDANIGRSKQPFELLSMQMCPTYGFTDCTEWGRDAGWEWDAKGCRKVNGTSFICCVSFSAALVIYFALIHVNL